MLRTILVILVGMASAQIVYAKDQGPTPAASHALTTSTLPSLDMLPTPPAGKQWKLTWHDELHAGHVDNIHGLSEGWHTAAVWWKQEEYIFYIDGKETWRTNAGGVSQKPEYMLLSNEIGKWGGDISKAKLPDEFLVDYVRVYDLADKP
jgi:hypothetical protein